MTATTTPNGFTYPTGGDAVGTLDTTVQSLAEQIDDRCGLTKSGVVSSPGTVVANTNYDVAVTFTTPFPASGPVPYIAFASVGVAPDLIWPPQITASSRTGFTIRFRRSAGTQQMSAQWIACNVGNW